MNSHRTIAIANYLCLIPGIFLVVSGGLILLAPNAANALFDLDAQNGFVENSLADTVGIRQLSIGLIICLLSLFRQTKALGIVMVAGSIIPLTDFLDFLPSLGILSAMRHGATVPVLWALGLVLLWPGTKAAR